MNQLPDSWDWGMQFDSLDYAPILQIQSGCQFWSFARGPRFPPSTGEWAPTHPECFHYNLATLLEGDRCSWRILLSEEPPTKTHEMVRAGIKAQGNSDLHLVGSKPLQRANNINFEYRFVANAVPKGWRRTGTRVKVIPWCRVRIRWISRKDIWKAKMKGSNSANLLSVL